MQIYNYIHQGGPIMFILLGLNIIGIAIMISKFVIFNKELKGSYQTAKELAGPLKEVSTNKDTNAMIEMSKQTVASHISKVEKGLNTVKIIAAISPLMGLLGTVIGVLVAFRVMSQTGLNDPSHFAQGISMALITTVGGMIVAIPHFVGHNYLLGMVDQLEISLEKEIIGQVV